MPVVLSQGQRSAAPDDLSGLVDVNGDGRADAGAPAQPDRTGTVGLWAVLGALALALALEVWIRWFASGTQFSPAPIVGPDHYATWRLVVLRVVEGLSAAVFVVLMGKAIISPLRRSRRLGTDGLIAIGCFVGSLTDGLLNIFKYIFAWNAHSINMGSWSAFMPFHAAGANPRYAEALLWGLPMYIYFCLGVAIAGSAVVRSLRRRYPGISNVSALAVVFVLACAFDFVVENLIIRVTQAYGYARTPRSVTLWAGHAYQFPLYEMVCVALLGVLFTAVRVSGLDAADGRTVLERGLHRFAPRWHQPLRILAFIGFSMVALTVVYHLPVNLLGTNGNSVAHLPSYLRP